MKKAKLKKFLIIFLFFISFFTIINVRADSGWDSSYDSGGSSSSSGSSWGSSSHSSSSGYHSPSSDETFFLFIIVIIFVCSGIFLVVNNKKFINEKYSESSYLSYEDISEDKLQSILPGMTLDAMRKIAYDKFVEIQNAWMNFDYEGLRELCTDELYNSYVSQLEVLKLKNGQNIMESFELLNNKIIDVRVDNGEVTVKVYMCVRFYDYVIDKKTNRTIRGTKSVKICNNYEMELVRKQNVDKEIHCPNCNAKINHNTSGECEYCGSTIVKAADDFVLSKKTNINK